MQRLLNPYKHKPEVYTGEEINRQHGMTPISNNSLQHENKYNNFFKPCNPRSNNDEDIYQSGINHCD